MDKVTREQVAKLYVATFNRAPLSEGLDYWTKSGFTIEMIAESFFDQEETQAMYPENITSGTFVFKIFNNLFNRLPAISGAKYWAEALDKGIVTRGNMVLAVANGATGDDAIMLSNKTEVALYYADQGGTSKDFSLAGITPDPDTVIAAKNEIDGVEEPIEEPEIEPEYKSILEITAVNTIALANGENPLIDFTFMSFLCQLDAEEWRSIPVNMSSLGNLPPEQCYEAFLARILSAINYHHIPGIQVTKIPIESDNGRYFKIIMKSNEIPLLRGDVMFRSTNTDGAMINTMEVRK